MSGTATKSKVSEELSREINDSVDEAMAETGIKPDKSDSGGGGDKEEKPADKGDEDIPSEEDRSDDDGSEGKTSDGSGEGEINDDDDDKDAVTDELIERAVISKHYSMAEAKAFPNATILKSVLDKLDAGKDSKDGGDTEPVEPVVDPLDAISDPDPNDYDDVIVSGFKALKEIARSQAERIKTLEATEAKNTVKGFFDSKVLGLSEEFAGALKESPEKLAALRKQHEVLVAGYEATGEETSPDAIFDQAVAVVMGDVKTTIKKKQLSQREKQQLQRPGGSKTKTSGDPLDEIADEIDKKHFSKK